MKKLINDKIIKIASILLVLGILSGVVFLLITSSLDKMIIKDEINSYINCFNSKVSINSFLTSFKYNIIYFIIITISGILYLFSPLIIFVNYYKGLQIGFLMSSIILTFKSKGILLMLVSLFPHIIFMSISIIIYSSIMLNISYKLMKATYNEESINLKIFVKKVLLLFLIGIVISLVGTLLEVFVNAYLVRLVI